MQLARNKTTIVDKWFGVIVDSYPADSAQFFRNNKDPFANPIGQTARQAVATLFDLLISKYDRNAAEAALTPLIRIRAVQAFEPSRALRFVFDLKRIVAESADRSPDHREELALLDERITELGLLAFDIYVQCREKIFELKANEVRSRTFKAFARAGLIRETEEGD